MNPEKIIETDIKNYLDKLPKCWYFKVHGGPFQIPGIPDIVGCYWGLFFGFEVKKDKKQKPSRIQAFIMQKIRKAGGIAEVVYSVHQVKTILQEKLEAIQGSQD